MFLTFVCLLIHEDKHPFSTFIFVSYFSNLFLPIFAVYFAQKHTYTFFYRGSFVMTSLWLRWCFWIEGTPSYPLIPNKHITLSFALLCKREQHVSLNASLALQRVEALIQTKQCQKLSAATFTFWIISSKISNQLSWGLLQPLCEGCSYNMW